MHQPVFRPVRCAPRGASALLLLLAAGAAARAQEAAPDVTAELVRLDVVVRDADGKAVGRLTREDFEVSEDGRPQRLTNFLFVGESGVPREAASTRPATPGEPAAPAPGERGPGRHLVIVVDDLHLPHGSVDRAKEALRRLVGELAPDDDVALVMASSPVSIHFTRDRASLEQAIDRLVSQDVAFAAGGASSLTPAQAELILRGDRSALLLATRLMMDEPGNVLGSNSPRAATEARDGATPAGLEPEEKAAAREIQRQARAVLAQELRFSEATLAAVDAVLRGLSSLPGRKLCVLVSDGFLVGTGTSEERTRRMRQVTDAATRSGAVVYALETRGAAPAGADAGVAGPGAPPGLRERVARLAEQENRETLHRLADETGGFLVRGTEDLAAGLGRMLQDDEAFYLIAYEPANPKRDGRFRRIDLRLPRHPDYVARTRKGYFAPDDRGDSARSDRLPAAVIRPPPLDEDEARAVLGAPLPPNGIPVRLTADYLDLPPAGPQAVVQAQVDVAGLPWRVVNGRHRAEVDLVGGLFDATGAPVGPPFGRHYELDLPPAEYERATRTGIVYRQRLGVRPGRYEVRLVARAPRDAPLGGSAEWVEVPDLGEKKLALSGVFLSSAGPISGPGGGETLRDAQAARHFARRESLYFQLYVYNPRRDDDGGTDVVLQAQIRSGAELVAASEPRPVTFQEKDGLPLPESNGMSLESLAPGGYELRVVVVDRKANATAHRTVDFTVE